jgi:hypothetical protein
VFAAGAVLAPAARTEVLEVSIATTAQERTDRLMMRN